MIDRAFIERMHDRTADMLALQHWHRIPVTGDHTDGAPSLELVAYVAMTQTTDGEMCAWFTPRVPTELDGKKLTAEAMSGELPGEYVQRVGWKLIRGRSERAATPSEEQIEASAIAIAQAIVGEAPLALYVSMRCVKTHARATEFWHPRHVDSQVIYRAFRRVAMENFG